jgi:hypothetical protein
MDRKGKTKLALCAGTRIMREYIYKIQKVSERGKHYLIQRYHEDGYVTRGPLRS